MLIGNADLIPSVFIPISPVTLALHWSPLLITIETLGVPLHLDNKAGKALAVFNPLANPKETGSSPDERHFASLLKHVCSRAIKLDALVLLVGSPGWDYKSKDSINEQSDLQNLIREFGFVYTRRKPVEG